MKTILVKREVELQVSLENFAEALAHAFDYEQAFFFNKFAEHIRGLCDAEVAGYEIQTYAIGGGLDDAGKEVLASILEGAK